MTLDEAIKRFESVKLYKNFEEYIEVCGDSRVKDGIKICGNPVNSLLFRGYGICDEDHCPDYKKCVERAEEHRQLAEWLKELRQLREQTRWIPVSERLPKKQKKSYWICTDGGYQCECRWTNVNPFWTDLTTDWHWHHMDVPSHQKVVAWMPLPEPYKVEKESEEE